MNPILRDFMPFILIGVGGLIMAAGGFNGYTFNPDSVIQWIGGIIAAIGTGWAAGRLIKVFTIMVINWVSGR